MLATFTASQDQPPKPKAPTIRIYRTAKGNYFWVTLRKSEATGRPITQDKAINLYEQATERHVEFSKAFPGVEIEDA